MLGEQGLLSVNFFPPARGRKKVELAMRWSQTKGQKNPKARVSVNQRHNQEQVSQSGESKVQWASLLPPHLPSQDRNGPGTSVLLRAYFS